MIHPLLRCPVPSTSRGSADQVEHQELFVHSVCSPKYAHAHTNSMAIRTAGLFLALGLSAKSWAAEPCDASGKCKDGSGKAWDLSAVCPQLRSSLSLPMHHASQAHGA